MTAGPQPPYGQQPPDGQSGHGPSGYGPPPGPGGSWGAAPPPPEPTRSTTPTARPSTVRTGIYALVANVVIGLLASVLTFGSLDSLAEDAARDGGISVADARTAVVIGAVIGLVFVALYCVVLWFAWQGRNWARIVLFVLGGLSLLFGLLGLASAGGVQLLLSVVQLVLLAVGIVYLALKPSSEWYRAEKQRRSGAQY
ncbi:hypothetical protein GB931_12590 [Modestobacter sp. I12A-02628]|uniref:Uncharacterized protein n=1 Tax=Goekera deserti TaxID=2497753 RepID=A0A7K3WBY6_9ACTN|nr:hypothetical protein [Goekera deserti]MPQ98742.1 hypothetical protein [Goekera deserti]NDI49305.1 hypothetical protein [Goekera deserti]NEL53043.1 hypothetical protein [Goekera deserti]